MEGRTFLRIGIVVTCLAVTALGFRNSNGDNSDAVAAATRAACGSEPCSASLEQQSRGSFGHEYAFRTERAGAGKPAVGRVIVACEREQVLIGDWRCHAKPDH
jgi:hypothetical protein